MPQPEQEARRLRCHGARHLVRAGGEQGEGGKGKGGADLHAAIPAYGRRARGPRASFRDRVRSVREPQAGEDPWQI
ncbi:hypothetical protein GCM10009075_08150 [Sphingomonas trueperi]